MADAGVVDRLVVMLGFATDKPSVAKTKKQINGILDGLANIVSAAAGATAALVANTHATALAVEEQGRLAGMLGMSADELGGLQAAFRQYGADTNDFVDAVATLADRAEDAAAGTASMVEDFGLVGLAVDDLRGKDPAELLYTFADAVAGTADHSRRTAAVVRVLGDDVGRKLAPLLMRGSDALRAMRDEAVALGLGATPEAVASSETWARSIRRLGMVVEGLRGRIGLRLLPALQRWVDDLTALWERNRAVILQRVDRYVDLVAGAFEALRGPLGVVVGLFTAWAMVRTGQQLAAMVPALSKLGVALAPVALWAAGFAALLLVIEDLWIAAHGGESVIGDLAGALGAESELGEALGELRELFEEVEGAARDFLGLFTDVEIEGLTSFLRHFAGESMRGTLVLIRDAARETRLLIAALRGDGAARADLADPDAPVTPARAYSRVALGALGNLGGGMGGGLGIPNLPLMWATGAFEADRALPPLPADAFIGPPAPSVTVGEMHVHSSGVDSAEVAREVASELDRRVRDAASQYGGGR